MAQMTAKDLARVLEAAVAADPDDLLGWLGLGRTCLALQDAARARQAFERALAILPGQPEASASLARLDFMAGDRGAIERLRAAAAAPSTAFYEGLYLGQSLSELGALAEAKGVLEKVRAAAPDNPFVLLELANVALQAKEPGRAGAYAMQAATLVPDQLMPWLVLSRALLAEGRLGEALSRLVSTAAGFSNEPAVWSELFDVAMLAGNTGAAQTAAVELRRLVPGADSSYKHGVTLLLADKVADARAAFDAAIKAAPTAPEPKQGLAKCLLAEGDEAGALALLTQANQLAPADSGVANDLAILLLRKKDAGGALRVLRPVLAVNPKDDAANLNVALAYVQDGKKKDAAPHVQAVLGSDDPAIRKQAEQLRGMVAG